MRCCPGKFPNTLYSLSQIKKKSAFILSVKNVFRDWSKSKGGGGGGGPEHLEMWLIKNT